MKAFFEEIAAGATPTIDECVESLGDELDLLRSFRDTPQDAEWHAEGDVHIHTGMVLNEAYALLEGDAAHLTGEARVRFVLGALLHDIAKPICTREQEVRGVVRTVARGHEAQGRSYLAPRLLSGGLTYETVEAVLGVVGYHHEPKLLVVKDRPMGAYQRVARLADPELLYWVEQADMRGRTCHDRKDAIEKIDLYRMFAEDFGAFVRGGTHADEWSGRLHAAMDGYEDAARDFVTASAQVDLEQGVIRSVEEAIARSYGQRDSFSELVITVGPSGSGKSTFVNDQLPDFDVVSLDAIREEMTGKRSNQARNDRVVAEGNERLKQSLRKKRDVVWDATSLRKDFRARTAGYGVRYGALVTLVVFHFDLATYEARNAAREHAVEPNVLARQISSMEWPELDEVHRVLYLDERHRVLGAYGFSGALPYGLEWA